MEGNSDSETNFSHKLSLTNTQVANLHQAFANYLSTYTKLSKLNYLKWCNERTYWSIIENRVTVIKKGNSIIS